MLTRFQLVGVGFAVALVCTAIEQWTSPLVVRASSSPVDGISDDAPPVDADELQAAHDRETELRVQVLAGLAAAKMRREQAAGNTGSSRKFIQTAYAARWSTVLTTNWPVFTKLREQAASSPTLVVPCTICEGTGRLHYCVVCADAKGKCVSCRDSGRTSVHEICPTCFGNQKCFLCFGSGQMPCPFCNEGKIEAQRPPPPNSLPIY